MANPNKRLDSNVPGNFYVDSTCINCDTCRQLAPSTFQEDGEYSTVAWQPGSDEQVHQAYQALLACPVGSIGTVQRDPARLQQAKASFPLHLADGVFYCGFNSEKSFGANSFFIRHPDGNWLIDSPRYLKPLVEAFERMGGLARIFLTHEDDVADAGHYAKHFGAKRIIHRNDLEAVPDAEWILEGTEAIHMAPRFLVIPVPGHTPGSQALLFHEQYLFTGDHLWWDPGAGQLAAPTRLVWHAGQLLHSIEALLAYRFEWVLAGHGDRVRLPVAEMRAHLSALIGRRKRMAVA